MNIKKIINDIFFIGVIDHDLEVFDIILETKYGTSYNSYLVKCSEKIAIFETVKVKFFDEYLEKLKSLVNLEDIDYIVVNHTEPDHSGSIEKLVDFLPNAKIVGSNIAIRYLKDIVNKDLDTIIVKPDETLSLGNKTLQFIKAPFLHWPDSMYTYIKEDKTLITCDSFGTHYAFDDVFYSKLSKSEYEDYLDSLKYYFDVIFSPFKKYINQAIERIEILDVDYILTGHGPVVDKDVDKIINIYKDWSKIEKKEKLQVTIPYASAYGYTGELAKEIQKGLEDEGILVKIYPIDVSNYHQIKQNILDDIYLSDGLLIGTSTINQDALPIIWDITISLNPITHRQKFASSFGSYGWSGEGVDYIITRLKQLKMKVSDGFKVKFKPSEKDLNDAYEFGKNFATYIKSINIPK